MGDGTFRQWADRKIDRLYAMADAPGTPLRKQRNCLDQIRYINQQLQSCSTTKNAP